MLSIDISALTQAELLRLLELARARSQHELAEQLAAELAARTSPAEWRTPESPKTAAPVAPEPPRRRRSLAVAAVAGATGVVAAAVVWGVSMPPAPQQATAVKISAPRAAMAIATSDPMPVESVPTIEPTTLQGPLLDGAPAPERPAPLRAASRPGHNPCFDLATPADRLVCGYPSLGDRERRLRAALQAASTARGDTQALDAEQSAWKARRDGISDRLALAALYDQRIRELTETGP